MPWRAHLKFNDELVDRCALEAPLSHQAVIDLHQLTGQVIEEFKAGQDGAPQ